ncbi:MAG: hypothetical protein AABY53_01875 [Bdellovibrionota bacterium]
MIKKINFSLLILTTMLYFVDIFLVLSEKIKSEHLQYDAHIVIIIFILASTFFYLKPTAPRWFGDKLPQDHEVAKIVGHVFSCFCLFPALIFCLMPIGN